MKPTRDHKVIRQWADRHDAFAAQLKRLKFDGEPAIMTFIFGEPQENAEPDIHSISWEMFFAELDLLGLWFVGNEQSPAFDLCKEAPSLRRTLP